MFESCSYQQHFFVLFLRGEGASVLITYSAVIGSDSNLEVVEAYIGEIQEYENVVVKGRCIGVNGMLHV